MQFRKMRIGDYEAMFALWSRTAGMGLNEADSFENIDRFLKRNEGLSFVCEDDGAVIGTVMCGHDGRRGYIYHCAVDEKYRGRGIGRELVIKGLEALRGEGMTKCHLFVFDGNEVGKGFWKGTGWTKRDDICVFSRNVY